MAYTFCSNINTANGFVLLQTVFPPYFKHSLPTTYIQIHTILHTSLSYTHKYDSILEYYVYIYPNNFAKHLSLYAMYGWICLNLTKSPNKVVQLSKLWGNHSVQFGHTQANTHAHTHMYACKCILKTIDVCERACVCVCIVSIYEHAYKM